MSHGNVKDALQVPGHLCINPTDLNTAFPHGGTALGLIRTIAVSPAIAHQEITQEEFGKEVSDMVFVGEAWTLAAVLQSYDKDAINTIFPNTFVGASSGKPVIEHPGTFRPGSLLSTKSVVLAFSPVDVERHRFVIFHRALPMVRDTAELALELSAPLEVGMVFAAVRDVGNRVVTWGLREDVTFP